MRLPLEEALLRYEACDAPPSYLSPAGRQYDVRPIFNELPQGRRLARGSACAGWISARSRVSAIGRRQLVDVCGGWEAADGGGVPQGTSLDERQIAAAKALLSRRLGLVQGPPGTGKTFIGLIVVRTLLRNARLWASSPARARAADRHALTAARAAEDEGGVRSVSLPRPPSPEALAEEARWLGDVMCFHLDEEWTPLEVHRRLGDRLAEVYARVREGDGGDEVGAVIMSLTEELLSFNFREAFVSRFEVANKAGEVLMMRAGMDVCCTSPDDESLLERFSAHQQAEAEATGGGGGSP